MRMIPEFFCFINVVIISRLIFTFRDTPATKKQVIIMILMQIAGLLFFEPEYSIAILAVTIIIINAIFLFFEQRNNDFNRLRLLSLVIHIIISSVAFSSFGNIHFNNTLAGIISSAAHYSLLIELPGNIDWHRFNIILSGLLLLVNEANILIRYQFQLFDLAPKKEIEIDKDGLAVVDNRKYSAGRVIGILERIIIYYFVLNNQFAAIGLIVAAKSFARFRELEKREFAEYVLTGTLLSTLLAMLSSSLAKTLLP